MQQDTFEPMLDAAGFYGPQPQLENKLPNICLAIAIISLGPAIVYFLFTAACFTVLDDSFNDVIMIAQVPGVLAIPLAAIALAFSIISVLMSSSISDLAGRKRSLLALGLSIAALAGALVPFLFTVFMMVGIHYIW